LERWRWLARDLQASGVLVNVAAAQLAYYQDFVPVWQTRTQVGRAARPTPLLKSQITRLTLNPTWTVPPTILREDKLPEIRRDLAFLDKHNLRVLDREGQLLDANSIDWNNPGSIQLRQDAGAHNPLGQVAIRFPNPFSVYLHDTPSQQLFAKGPRAFSSGCVRVEAVMQLVDLLLTPAERERVTSLLASGRTHEFRLSTPLPIILAYWTAEVDGAGQLLYAPDIYARDQALLAALDRAQL
ncbi:MAG: L,D-transpeptidase family protein, partial [Pseudomonas sp.]|nr:L,D-transpeptidase family protein [Pseudomonas sp.]